MKARRTKGLAARTILKHVHEDETEIMATATVAHTDIIEFFVRPFAITSFAWIKGSIMLVKGCESAEPITRDCDKGASA